MKTISVDAFNMGIVEAKLQLFIQSQIGGVVHIQQSNTQLVVVEVNSNVDLFPLVSLLQNRLRLSNLLFDLMK